jgi:hypothetical protein
LGALPEPVTRQQLAQLFEKIAGFLRVEMSLPDS